MLSNSGAACLLCINLLYVTPKCAHVISPTLYLSNVKYMNVCMSIFNPHAQVLWIEITNVTKHNKRPIRRNLDAVFQSYCTEQKVLTITGNFDGLISKYMIFLS